MFRILPILLVAGCFDSLVDNPCIDGYELQDGHCVVPVAEPEPPDPLQPPSNTLEPVCTADTENDPMNCGACGRECASGICDAGHCAGSLSGHVIAIGHDYGKHNAAMARVLGNAVALGAHHDVAVARWRDPSVGLGAPDPGIALGQAMNALGRPWHTVAVPATPALEAFANIDVLLVDAQTRDGDALANEAAAWAPAIDRHLQNGGVVIVLAVANSTSHRFLAGANLASWPAPVDASGLPATIDDPADAVVQQVVSPYMAAPSSGAFPNMPGTIVTQAGAIVIHETRY